MTKAELVAGTPHYDEVEDFYGSYSHTPRSDIRGWVTPDPVWVDRNIVSIMTDTLPGFPVYSGTGTVVSRIRMHRKAEAPFRAVWAELVSRGLTDRLRTYDGAFTPRHMGHDPKRPLSMHAKGCAIDFDAQWNSYGLPASQAQIDREVVAVFEKHGWCWGGRWSDPYEDAMHFEFVQQRKSANWDIEPKQEVWTAPERPQLGPVAPPLSPSSNRAMRIFAYDETFNPDTQDLLIRFSPQTGKIHIDAQDRK